METSALFVSEHFFGKIYGISYLYYLLYVVVVLVVFVVFVTVVAIVVVVTVPAEKEKSRVN